MFEQILDECYENGSTDFDGIEALAKGGKTFSIDISNRLYRVAHPEEKVDSPFGNEHAEPDRQKANADLDRGSLIDLLSVAYISDPIAGLETPHAKGEDEIRLSIGPRKLSPRSHCG